MSDCHTTLYESYHSICSSKINTQKTDLNTCDTPESNFFIILCALSPLIKLVGDIFIAHLQLLDISSLAVNVWAVLLVALLQGATQLLCSLQILTQLLHVILCSCHRPSPGLNISKVGQQFKMCQLTNLVIFSMNVKMNISSPGYPQCGLLSHLEHQGPDHLH